MVYHKFANVYYGHILRGCLLGVRVQSAVEGDIYSL